jgi:hypothetical protein
MSKRLISQFHRNLMASQASNGLWGPNNGSVEPTCLAVLALRRIEAVGIHRAIKGLLRLQNRDGSWPISATDDRIGSWTTALAVLSLISVEQPSAQFERGIRWLLRTHGREGDLPWSLKFRFFDHEVQFDPAKYGWNWIAGTTSWVIPTAFTIIALRRVKQEILTREPDLNVRIRLGNSMLLDRMCPEGGWNAGNGVAFGVPYSPYIDATSIALLALRGHKDHLAISRSLSWLSERIVRCPAPYSLGWGIIALAAYRDTDLRVEHALTRANEALVAMALKILEASNTETLAACALALDALEGADAFEV